MTQKVINIERNAGNLIVGDSPEYQVNTAINELITKLASMPFTFENTRRKPSSETIEKLKHNNIGAKKHIIKQYLDFSSKIESAYKAIDSSIPFGKQIVIQNLNDLYFAALDEVGIDYFEGTIDMSKVRENSEYILDFVIQKLRNLAYESKNTPTLKEEVNLGVNVIVAHAFIECIVMENPE
jgi:hypothetical protein